MNKQLIQEALDTIQNINSDLEEQLQSEKYSMDPWIYAEVQVNSEGCVVMFLGECIWNSENDEREEIQERPEIGSGSYYEPLEPYIRKSIMTLIEKLNKIKL